MNRYFKMLPTTIAAVCVALVGQAQEKDSDASWKKAIRPINASDQMFRKTIWRQIDLREKQNQPLFSDGREITRIMLDAVKRGKLQAYQNDSLTSKWDAKTVSSNMSYAIAPNQELDSDFITVPRTIEVREQVFLANGRPKLQNGRPVYRMVEKPNPAFVETPPPATSAEYRAKDMHQLVLTEEMIFDKKRSRMYHQIKTVSILLPSTLPGNVGGLEKNVATFKYEDLVSLFRKNPEKAIWFNAQNDSQHKNLADAFELGLFNSYITKVSNSSNSTLSDIYGGDKEGILAAQQTASDLVEYEYNLWSF